MKNKKAELSSTYWLNSTAFKRQRDENKNLLSDLSHRFITEGGISFLRSFY